MIEIWKDIPEWEGIYQVSNFGRLKSFKKHPDGLLLKQTNKNGDYFSVVLSKNNRIKSTRTHRLVAENFIPNPENKPQVNHIDMNKQNNHVENLEWCTSSENTTHAYTNKPSMCVGMNYYNQNIRPKTILQLDMDDNLINEFKNSTEAYKNTGVCARNILQVASKDEYLPGKVRNQAGGYKWKHKE